MSASDRGKWGQIGLLTASIFALAAGLAIGGQAYLADTDAQAEAENRANNYTHAARVEVYPECIAAKLTVLQCEKKTQRSYRPDQRDEYDLQAQKTMAAWTRAMGIAAVIGMSVGILGVGLIYLTLSETRKAAESASKTYEAYIAIERPRLRIVARPVVGAGDLAVKIHATNIGKTDAVVYLVGCRWADSSTFYEDEIILARPQSVIVKTSEDKLVWSMGGGQEGRTHLCGYIKYRSPVSGDHRSYFCFHFHHEGNRGQDAYGQPMGRWVPYDAKGADWPADT